MHLKNLSAALLCSTCLMTYPVAAFAESGVADLGLILLGESKRDVQTGTAVPLTIVDQEEMNDRQAGTVAELVDAVPGVTLINGSTPQGSGINIRGFGANSTFGSDQKVLILQDNATVGSEELYRIGTQLFTDPELYKSVSVSRGTVGSFEYGSGVIGGLVKLETKDGSDFTNGTPGIKVRQTLQYGSNGDGAVSSTILAWQPTDRLEFIANYTLRDQDDMKDGSGAVIPNSATRLPSWLLKGKYTFGDADQHQLSFSYTDTTADDKDVPYDTFQTTTGFGNVDRLTESKTATLAYNFNPDSDLINLDVILSKADQQIDSEGVDGQVGGIADLVNADHQFETTKLTLKNTAFFETGAASHDLRAGIELIRRKRLDASSAPGGEDRRWAVFVVDDIKFGNISVTPALRYESSKITGSTAPNNGTFENDAFMGGLSLKYDFSSGLSVFGSGAYTENLPIIDDLGNTVLMTKSEKAETYELGVAFDNGGPFTGKLTAYKTRVWDITSYRSFVPGGNTDMVDISGVELEASFAAENGVYVDFNANALSGEATLESALTQDWDQAPADSISLTLGKKFQNGWDTSWELVSAKARDNDGVVTPGYTIHNIRASWKPQTGVLKGGEVRLGIENAFDRDYATALGGGRKSPGRNIKLTLAKTF
ncbi:MAG: TonB-dependent receptor plug domain-containing protein [Rhodobacteraceae bacterium]|nr:TonB-dependent receptor plug domain-containing protein [Paracoccaceae bacterium]